jgi:hypothetical protein
VITQKAASAKRFRMIYRLEKVKVNKF